MSELTYYRPTLWERFTDKISHYIYLFASRNEKSVLVKHAKRELEALGYVPLDFNQPDDSNKWIQENVLELLEVFSRQGHSGMSAPECLSLFSKLARYEPLCPLTGDISEWNECGDGVFQNNRCSNVFKQHDRFDGQPYDIHGKVFREPDGCCYTSYESFVLITFPYTPTTVYVDVEKQNGNNQ